MRCPHCDHEHPANNIYCPLTGKPIPTPDVCPHCSKPVDPQWLHCAFCGQPISLAALAPIPPIPVTAAPRQAAGAAVEPQETRQPSPTRCLPLALIGTGILLMMVVVAFFVFWKGVNIPLFKNNPPPENLLFVSDRSGNNDIYLVDASGGDPVNLTNNPADDSKPVWSPDAQKIAFTSNRDDTANLEIYLMNADGSQQTRLTANGEGFGNFAFSPDGQEIAYSSFDPFSTDLASMTADQTIYIMNLNDSSRTRLTTNRTFMLDMGFSWSPDGQKITYISIRDEKAGIYQINSDGSGEKALTNNDDFSFNLSRDGRKIAFTSHRDGNPEIYVMDADGSNQTRLTSDPANDSYPVWSPDGKKIAFVTERDGNLEIYVMNADGSDQTNLTNHPGVDSYYQWSMDGRQIAFASDRDGNYEIYLINADGSQQTRLTNSSGLDLYAVWAPANVPGVNQAVVTDKPATAPAAATSGVLVRPTNPLGMEGYWKSIGGNPYAISLIDANGRQATLEVLGDLRWDKEGRLTQWEGATFKFQTEADRYTWSDIIDAEVVDGLLVLTAHFGFYTVFTEGHLPTPLNREIMPVTILADGRWKGQATYIITGFNPQNFSATIYQDTGSYQIQREAAAAATATGLPSAPIITATIPVIQMPTQPAVSDATQEYISLLQECERIFIISENQALVPDLSDCNHELLLSTINGNVLGIVSPSKDMAFLPSNGMLAAIFPDIKFNSYSLSGNTIDQTSARYWGTGEVWISYSAPDTHIAIVKLDSTAQWSGYLDLAKPGFDPAVSVDQQSQSPLHAGNQFE